MGAGETLSGTITDTAGRGVMDVRVAAYRSDGGSWTYVRDVTTDAGGRYRDRRSRGSEYRVRVHDDDWGADRYVPEWFDDASSLEPPTDVAVVPGAGAVVDEDLVHRAEIVGLGSSTHPDETAWYRAADASIAWTAADPAGVVGYGWLLDRSPGTSAHEGAHVRVVRGGVRRPLRRSLVLPRARRRRDTEHHVQLVAVGTAAPRRLDRLLGPQRRTSRSTSTALRRRPR